MHSIKTNFWLILILVNPSYITIVRWIFSLPGNYVKLPGKYKTLRTDDVHLHGKNREEDGSWKKKEPFPMNSLHRN